MDLRIHGPDNHLRGELTLPGDKSISHRVILLAGMADGPSRLRGVLQSGVTAAMIDCLLSLGVELERLAADDLLIVGKNWSSPGKVLDCENSGTTMRLLIGALASSRVEAVLDGTPRLRQRPMARLIEPLSRMGADIEAANDRSQPPLRIRGAELHGIQYQLPVASAQVKSGLLLAGLKAEGVTEISEPAPTRDHTERLLKTLGASIMQTNGTIRLFPQRSPLPNFSLAVPGDMSSAAFPMAAALLSPNSRVTLRSIGINPTRSGLVTTLKLMGADIKVENVRYSLGEPMADLTISSSELQATEVGPDQVVTMIDELPIMAIAASQAEGITTISGASELRVKESDRIDALTKGLKKMGAEVEARADGLVIQGPTPLQGAEIDSHNDHRIAMAFSVAGLIAEGTTIIRDADCIAESYPAFASDLDKLGADLQ